jgi:glutathione S-transferase
MALELHLHPLSSYCWKVLIALYELEAPFTPVTVDLGDPEARAAYLQLSPFGKIPALRDTARGAEVFESSIIIDYLDQHYPGRAPLIPDDRDQAREVRLWDRLFDLHVHDPFQRLIDDRLRPEAQRDPLGVERARARLRRAYEVLDQRLGGRTWAVGEAFSLADCAAAPPLFYAGLAEPLEAHPTLSAYRRRLLARPSVARAIDEAQPYFHMFPATPAERARMPTPG